MRVRKLNESVKNAEINKDVFNRSEAQKFISEDGKDTNWNKYYDIVELENEPLEEKLIEFDPNDWEEEDIKFWNHIDWQKNGYSDFARTDDTITAKVTKYSMHNDPETKEVTMCKYFRANPIYPPYYAAVEKPFDNCVGPMYDGHKAGKVDIHDRYETQEVYDLLSEAHNSNGEANKLTDFLTANADKIKSLADCAPYILDDISDVTINTAAAKDSEEMNTMIDIAGACAKEFGYPNFETLRADDDVEVHFEAAKYLSKFVDARKLGQMIKEVRDEIADCERFVEELLKEDLGEDVGEYQEWVDYDMKKYGRISKETFDNLRKAGLTAVKDEYGDYEVISKEKIHEACKKRKVDKKLEESIIYTSEGLNNAMKEFAKVVRDWKKTHVDSQEEKVIAESNWDDDSFNAFIATLEG